MPFILLSELKHPKNFYLTKMTVSKSPKVWSSLCLQVHHLDNDDWVLSISQEAHSNQRNPLLHQVSISAIDTFSELFIGEAWVQIDGVAAGRTQPCFYLYLCLDWLSVYFNIHIRTFLGISIFLNLSCLSHVQPRARKKKKHLSKTLPLASGILTTMADEEASLKTVSETLH